MSSGLKASASREAEAISAAAPSEPKISADRMNSRIPRPRTRPRLPVRIAQG